MGHPDNARLGYIEGGRFESISKGDERDATIAAIKMPTGFKLSARSLIILEVEEWDEIRDEIQSKYIGKTAELKTVTYKCSSCSWERYGYEGSGSKGKCPLCESKIIMEDVNAKDR